MNSSKKVRSLDTFPRVRKRKSTGNKAVSHGSHNAVQRRASLLKNNKSLAITLQETRCELSSYKSFFEESLEYINKTKLVKSSMVVLTDTLKNLLKAFEENLLSLDFDESKLPNVKASSQSKILQNGMNPVLEAANEVTEGVFADRDMNYNDESCPNPSGPKLQRAFNQLEYLENDTNEEMSDPKNGNKTPQRKSEDVVPKNHMNLGTETKRAVGNEDEGLEIPNLSLNKYSGPLTAKETAKSKIPRCQGVNLKRQDFAEKSKSTNRASKRKSPENNCEESASDFSRRKTFVVKSNRVVVEPVSTENLTDGFHLDEGMKIPEDQLISKNDKRQTFVVKKNNILKETEPVVYLNKIDDKEFIAESRISVDETTACSKRKTFVKKNRSKILLQQNDYTSESDQMSFPYGGCAVNSEIALTVTEKGEQNENWISSCNAEFNNSETIATVKNKLKENDVCAINKRTICNDKQKPQNSPSMNENTNEECSPVETNVSFFESSESDVIKAIASSVNLEHSAKAISLNMNALSEVSLSENIKSTVDGIASHQITTEAAKKDVVAGNERTIFSDKQMPSSPSMDENTDKEYSPRKTRRSFLESSESECDVIVLDEFDFGDSRPVMQTTPIRRQISKSKKKKFVFYANKKKPALKKSLSNEIVNSKTGDNCSQEKTVDADISNKINEIREKDDVIYSLSEPLNPADIPSNVCTAQKQTKKKSERKVKDNQSRRLKSNANKKKPVLKKNLSNEIVNSKTSDNCSQEKTVDDLFDADMNHEIRERDDVMYSLSEPLNPVDIPSNVQKQTKKKSEKKIKDNQNTHLKSNTGEKANKKVRKNKKNPIEIDDLSSKPLTKKKKNLRKNENICFDDNTISKFVDVDKAVKVTDVQDKDSVSDFSCKRTGKNTFLVQAEIHPPPPSFSTPKVKERNKANDELKLPCMQLAVVLSDVLKSKDYEHLNISDKKNLSYSKPVSQKSRLSGSADNFAIDPEESIEKLRCDPAPDADDYDLHSDAIIDTGCSEISSDPQHDIENPRARRKKGVNYKEPSLIRKMRRC